MRWMLVVLGVIWLAAGTARADLPFGVTFDLTLTHDSELRTYDVIRPDGIADATPAPLVVDLHGFGSNRNQQRLISNWSALSEVEGFLVAWPDGIDNSWNGISCCGTGVSSDVDDVGFIRAMVAAIQAEVNVDAGRIYVTGLSNGGAMSHRLACEAADVFTAAAPMASRSAGVSMGAGASSISFWWRRWMQHSLSPRWTTLPWASPSTWISM